MRIHHFCAWRHLRSIQRHGLVIGGILEPREDGDRIHNGWNWLTLDPDASRQSWNTHNLIPYNRAAWRLTIEIPEDKLENLYDRARLAALYPACDKLFEGWAGSENWRVYHGQIPPAWIVAAEKADQLPEEKGAVTE